MPQSDIVYIAVDHNGVVDSGLDWFFSDEMGFEELDWEAIYAIQWKNTKADPDRQRKKQAEYMVKTAVPVSWPERKQEVEAYLAAHIGAVEKSRLALLTDLIDGFQSPAGLELLASLDFLIQAHKTFDKNLLGQHLRNWSSRKKKMFSPHQIEAADK